MHQKTRLLKWIELFVQNFQWQGPESDMRESPGDSRSRESLPTGFETVCYPLPLFMNWHFHETLVCPDLNKYLKVRNVAHFEFPVCEVKHTERFESWLLFEFPSCRWWEKELQTLRLYRDFLPRWLVQASHMIWRFPGSLKRISYFSPGGSLAFILLEIQRSCLSSFL